MLGRVGVRACVMCAVILLGVWLPTAAGATASPDISVAIGQTKMLAQGAALDVGLTVQCGTGESFYFGVGVTQQTVRGVQHAMVWTVFRRSCTGAPQHLHAFILPPVALDPPETLHAVYETAWSTKPALIHVDAGTDSATVTKDQVVQVRPATAASPAIAPTAERKAQGAGLVVRMHLSCTPIPTDDPQVSDKFVITVAQVGAHQHVQQLIGSVNARCDGAKHTYQVPFAAAVQPWRGTTAFVKGDVCAAYLTYCQTIPRTVFRTVTVQP